MLVKMLAEHRELQFGHRYDLPEPRALALAAQGFAVALEQPEPEPVIEEAVAPAAPEKAVAPQAKGRRRKR